MSASRSSLFRFLISLRMIEPSRLNARCLSRAPSSVRLPQLASIIGVSFAGCFAMAASWPSPRFEKRMILLV
jgi:hypothetical protein